MRCELVETRILFDIYAPTVRLRTNEAHTVRPLAVYTTKRRAPNTVAGRASTALTATATRHQATGDQS